MAVLNNRAFIILILVLNVYGAKLQIVEAEVNGGINHWKKGPLLNDINVLCATDLFRSFSIICIPDEAALAATFYIDGEYINNASTFPYMIFGDDGVKAFPWVPLPESAIIECFLDNDEEIRAEIFFSCDPMESMINPDTVSGAYPAHTKAKLQIIQAGISGGVDQWNRGPFLTYKNVLCPANLFSLFSVICIPSEVSNSVEFYLDSSYVHKKISNSFTLFGDDGIKANGWDDLPESVNIKCCTDNGETVEAHIDFECPGQKIIFAPAQIPGSKLRRASDATNPPLLSSTMANKVANSTNGSLYYIQTRFQNLSSVSVEESTCVTIPAIRFVGSSSEWQKIGTGLAFKLGDQHLGFDEAGKYPLTYSFTAPTTDRYAFTIEMETANSVIHNDVWVQFPDGGFKLIREDSMLTKAGWVQAYHNRIGRAVEAYAVEFRPHRFTTKKVLQAGKRYTVKISGRSSKVTIFKIVMFPCSEENCYIGRYYDREVERCST